MMSWSTTINPANSQFAMPRRMDWSWQTAHTVDDHFEKSLIHEIHLMSHMAEPAAMAASARDPSWTQSISRCSLQAEDRPQLDLLGHRLHNAILSLLLFALVDQGK